MSNSSSSSTDALCRSTKGNEGSILACKSKHPTISLAKFWFLSPFSANFAEGKKDRALKWERGNVEIRFYFRRIKAFDLSYCGQRRVERKHLRFEVFQLGILEVPSKKIKFMNLGSKDHPGVSSVFYGNNQYYGKENFAEAQQGEFENIKNALLHNVRPSYFQHREPSFSHDTCKEEITKLPDFEHIGRARFSEQSRFKSECSSTLLSTFLHAQDKEQGGMIMPYLPVVLEASSCMEACLENVKPKNNAYASMELETINLGKQGTPTTEHRNHSFLHRSLCANASYNIENSAESGSVFPANIGEQKKNVNGRVSPVVSEKIWDGSLKLNTSTTVSATAFFKSGEQAQDLNWPDLLEIKGKVRLPAFEKFIQELPRSRNRALMVISLCWKVGSGRGGLAGMMEVAKGYRESEKVGFAQIPPGIDLYVCPRSDIIITILAKYGFFKGMAAVEEDQDSLIGCVVWRRNQSSINSVPKNLEGKKALIHQQPLNSTGLSAQGMNSALMQARDSENKQVITTATELQEALNSQGGTSPTVVRSMIIESNATPSSNGSHHVKVVNFSTVQAITSFIPYSSPIVPAQLNTSQRTSLNLPQADMNPTSITLSKKSGNDKAVLISDSPTQFVSTPQVVPGFFLVNSHSSTISRGLGNLGAGPAPAPRPLVPVDSSNFQFLPQLAQKAHSSSGDGNAGSDSICPQQKLSQSFQAAQPSPPGSPPLPPELMQRLIQSIDKKSAPSVANSYVGSGSICVEDSPVPSFQRTQPALPGPPPLPAELMQSLIQSNEKKPAPSLVDGNAGSGSTCAGKGPVPTFQATQAALPGPPPLPPDLLQRLIDSNKTVPKDGRKLQDEIHILHKVVTRGHTEGSETRAPSAPKIQETCDDSSDDNDLPEFDFNSACGIAEAPMCIIPGCTHPTSVPDAPPLNRRLSFEAPWSMRECTLITTSMKSVEALQQITKPSSLPSKLLNTNEGSFLKENLGEIISMKTASTHGSQLLSQPSSLKKAKDSGNDPRHGFDFARKHSWVYDDDDMPEWCPPDLEPLEEPLQSENASASTRLMLGRPVPIPDITTSLSSHPEQRHPRQSLDLHQRSHHGLLGPRPTAESPAGRSVQTRATGEIERSDPRPPKPPLRRNSFRHHASKFNRRPHPYDGDRKRRRR